MRHFRPVALLVSLLLIVAPATALAQDDVANESEPPNLLFVLSGSSGSATDDELTLDGVSSVVYFSERPERIAGHMSLADFSAAWGEPGDDGAFATDPPNAVLSLLEHDRVDDVVLELLSLRTDDESATFTVDVLDGTLPAGEFGPASLFIDSDCPSDTAMLGAMAATQAGGTLSGGGPLLAAFGGLVFQNNYVLVICLTPDDVNHIKQLS